MVPVVGSNGEGHAWGGVEVVSVLNTPKENAFGGVDVGVSD
jgi:hypothetical protein